MKIMIEIVQNHATFYENIKIIEYHKRNNAKIGYHHEKMNQEKVWEMSSRKWK